MTTYNTGNPIGSKDPRDLYDNAENLDEAVNTRQAESWDDRFGVARKTWYGMEQDFQQFLINSGYETIGDYGPGLEITERNQIFWRDGELYRAGAVLELPYTTTGDWGAEEGLFVAVGDAALRQELSQSSGSSIVGHESGTVESALGEIKDDIQDQENTFNAFIGDLADPDSTVQVANLPAWKIKQMHQISLMDSGVDAVELLARQTRPQKMYVRYTSNNGYLTISIASQVLEASNIRNAVTYYNFIRDVDGLFDLHSIQVGREQSAGPGTIAEGVDVMGSSVTIFAISARAADSTGGVEWVPAHSGTPGVSDVRSTKVFWSNGDISGNVENLPSDFTETDSVHISQGYQARDINHGNSMMWIGEILHGFTIGGWSLDHKIDFQQDTYVNNAYMAQLPALSSTFTNALVYGSEEGNAASLTQSGGEAVGIAGKNALFYGGDWAPGRPIYYAMTVENFRDVLNTEKPYSREMDSTSLITDRADGVAKIYFRSSAPGVVVPAGEVWRTSFKVLAGISVYPSSNEGLF